MDDRPSPRPADDPAAAPSPADHPAAAPAAGDEPLEAFYGQDDIFGLKLPGPAPVPKPPPRRTRTATGALLTGIALGLRDVFDPEKKHDTVAIEQEAPAEPEGPQEYEVRLASSPRDSQAIYRPWVAEEGDPTG